MKRRWLIRLSLLVILAAFVVWLEPTRVVWGWLRGEAFYQGRPTSYWREKCDEWLERFDDQDSLTNFTWLLPFEVPAEPGLRMFGIPDDLRLTGGSIKMPRDTWLRMLVNYFRSEETRRLEERYYFAPRILWATPDSESVLLQLQQEEKYRWLATLALRRVQHYREVERDLFEEHKAAQ